VKRKGKHIPGRGTLIAQLAKTIRTPTSQNGFRLIGIRCMH
jgi:hypothetical protein